jgi:hypothetical protein
VHARLLESRAGGLLKASGLQIGEDVCVAFAPERIDHGVSGHEQLRTPRVLGGVTETCFRRAGELLRHTCAHLHRVSSPEAAEMVKLYENTFRAVNIVLAFEIAEACRLHGCAPRARTWIFLTRSATDSGWRLERDPGLAQPPAGNRQPCADLSAPRSLAVVGQATDRRSASGRRERGVPIDDRM